MLLPSSFSWLPAYLTLATGSDAVCAFLVDTGGTSQADVGAALRARLDAGAIITDLTWIRAQVGSSLTSVDLHGLTRLELAFAVLLAAGAGGIVLAVGLAGRRRALAIMVVLGADPNVLIVILTARADEIDIVVGLDSGADDYVVTPATVTVLLGGREIFLRPKEFDLLTALSRRPGTAVSREDLMAEVWDEHWFGSTKTLDVTMAALRRRLADEAVPSAARATPVITTLRGHGYRLEEPPAP